MHKDAQSSSSSRKELFQCDQIWQNIATLAKVYKFLANFWMFFLIWQNAEPIWHIRDIFGPIFIVANGQTLKNNLTIWSHWAFLRSTLKEANHWTMSSQRNYERGIKRTIGTSISAALCRRWCKKFYTFYLVWRPAGRTKENKTNATQFENL